MNAIWAWLLAGSPAHYLYVSVAAILLLEDIIARSPLKANSTIQLAFQLLEKIPVLGPIFAFFRLGPKQVASFLLPLLLAGGLVGMAIAASGCAHSPPAPPSPQTQQYDAAFASCMEGLGIQAAVTTVSNLYNILVTGGNSATEIEQKLEKEAEQIAGSAAQDTAYCAVISWQSLHPVLPPTPPTPSQGAARIFTSKFKLSHPTLKPHAELSTGSGDQAPDRAVIETDDDLNLSSTKSPDSTTTFRFTRSFSDGPSVLPLGESTSRLKLIRVSAKPDGREVCFKDQKSKWRLVRNNTWGQCLDALLEAFNVKVATAAR